MINIRKIRQLIFNLLEYYSNKELDYKSSKYYYYSLNLNNYNNEFLCLVNEKKIGLYTKLKNKDIIICIKLLEMLYERDYDFILVVYEFFMCNIKINFIESLDDIIFWKKLFSKYYELNKIKILKYENLPSTLKNYKTKKYAKYYKIDDIKNDFYIKINES
jgi:hypothetical protein